MEEVPTRSIGQGIDSKEYRSAETKGKTADNATLNGIDADIKSVSSLEPSPPTPPPNVVTASATEIGLPPNSAEGKATEERTVLASKRLCERWLDNLFMVLYEVQSPLSPPSLFSEMYLKGTLAE